MKKIYYIFTVFIIFMSACKKDASIKEEQLNAPGKTIAYHLKNGGEVTVAINNKGEYVVGGDVILSKDQIAYLEYNKVGNGKETTPRSTFTGEFQKLWPGGIIYYVINDATHSSDILSAINAWESSTPIRFVQRTNQANYVNFQGAPPNGGGDSQLGMVGGQQLIRLSAGANESTVIHEIGHAVGLMHEQTRTDRDQYINIDFSNINSDWIDQYKTYDVLGRSGLQIGTFDYNSVMLYPSSVPEARVGTNTSPQMTRKDGSIWWYNAHLSQGDIDGVNYLYNPQIFIKVVPVFNEGESYYNVSVTNEDVRQVYDVYAEFYSNEALTSPLTLSSPIAIRVNNTGIISTATISSGLHSVYLGQSIEEYSTEYGTYRYYNTTSLGVAKGVGYRIPGVN